MVTQNKDKTLSELQDIACGIINIIDDYGLSNGEVRIVAFLLQDFLTFRQAKYIQRTKDDTPS